MGDIKATDDVRMKNTNENFSSPSMNALNLPTTNNFKTSSSGSTEVNYAIGKYTKPFNKKKYKKKHYCCLKYLLYVSRCRNH